MAVNSSYLGTLCPLPSPEGGDVGEAERKTVLWQFADFESPPPEESNVTVLTMLESSVLKFQLVEIDGRQLFMWQDIVLQPLIIQSEKCLLGNGLKMSWIEDSDSVLISGNGVRLRLSQNSDGDVEFNGGGFSGVMLSDLPEPWYDHVEFLSEEDQTVYVSDDDNILWDWESDPEFQGDLRGFFIRVDEGAPIDVGLPVPDGITYSASVADLSLSDGAHTLRVNAYSDDEVESLEYVELEVFKI